MMSITIKNHSFLKKFTMLSKKRFMGGNIYGLLYHNNQAFLITSCKLVFYWVFWGQILITERILLYESLILGHYLHSVVILSIL